MSTLRVACWALMAFSTVAATPAAAQSTGGSFGGSGGSSYGGSAWGSGGGGSRSSSSVDTSSSSSSSWDTDPEPSPARSEPETTYSGRSSSGGSVEFGPVNWTGLCFLMAMGAGLAGLLAFAVNLTPRRTDQLCVYTAHFVFVGDVGRDVVDSLRELSRWKAPDTPGALADTLRQTVEILRQLTTDVADDERTYVRSLPPGRARARFEEVQLGLSRIEESATSQASLRTVSIVVASALGRPPTDFALEALGLFAESPTTMRALHVHLLDGDGEGLSREDVDAVLALGR